MRLELGALTVEVERQEDAAAFVRGLLRHLNNVEVAGLLGVSTKTVRRWKRAGRLPDPAGGQINLLELLHHLQPQHDAPGGTGVPARLAAGTVVTSGATGPAR